MFNLMKVITLTPARFPFPPETHRTFLTHQFQVLPHHSQDSRPGKTETTEFIVGQQFLNIFSKNFRLMKSIIIRHWLRVTILFVRHYVPLKPLAY